MFFLLCSPDIRKRWQRLAVFEFAKQIMFVSAMPVELFTLAADTATFSSPDAEPSARSVNPGIPKYARELEDSDPVPMART